MVNLKEYVAEIYEELHIELDVLAKIHVGQKLNTQNKYVQIDKTSLFQGIARYLHGDDRTKTVNKLSAIMNHSVLALGAVTQNIKLEPHTTELYNVFNTLSQKIVDATAGLHNLAVTYADDISTRVKIVKMANNAFNMVETYKKIINREDVYPL